VLAAPAQADTQAWSPPSFPDGPDAVARQAGGLVSDFGLDLVSARVDSVWDSTATVSRPPVVLLHVREVLDGRLPRGPLLCRWVSLSTLFKIARCGNETAAEAAAWHRALSRPVRGPSPGTWLLLGGHTVSGDSLWVCDPGVRVPDTPHNRFLLGMAARDAENARYRRSLLAEQQQRERTVADRRRRDAVHLGAMVRASTDIVVARVGWSSKLVPRRLDIIERLYQAPDDPIFMRVDSLLGVGLRGPDRRMDLLDPPEGAARHLLADAGLNWVQPCVCFLRRGAPLPLPYERGLVPVVLVDRDGGLLPADPATVRQVRRLVAGARRHGPWPASRPAECGASLERFAELRGAAWDTVQVGLLYARPGNSSERVQSFVFRTHGYDWDPTDLVWCDSCSAFAWSDQMHARYPVRVPRAALARWVGDLATRFRGGVRVPADSVHAIVTVRGVVGGVPRTAEQRLTRDDLTRVVADLTTAVAADSLASWRVDYMKYAFGAPLAPQPGWHPAGR
jgi:hypothetical protein